MSSLDVLVALIGGACFAVVYRIPRRYFPIVMLLAASAKLGQELFPEKVDRAFATFVVSFAIASVGHILARRTGKPAQAFLVPGVVFLVPGTMMYRAMVSALDSDILGLLRHTLSAFAITAAISFAILLANWIVPSKRTL